MIEGYFSPDIYLNFSDYCKWCAWYCETQSCQTRHGCSFRFNVKVCLPS